MGCYCTTLNRRMSRVQALSVPGYLFDRIPTAAIGTSLCLLMRKGRWIGLNGEYASLPSASDILSDYNKRLINRRLEGGKGELHMDMS